MSEPVTFVAHKNEKVMEYSYDNVGTQKYESIIRMLRQLLERQTETNKLVSDLKVMRDALVGNIQMDSLTLQIILDVSDSTLYRWRISPPPNNLPHYVRDNGSIYYDYDEVLTALRKGRLSARGFSRLDAIKKMIKYREDVLTAKGGSSWFATDNP